MRGAPATIELVRPRSAKEAAEAFGRLPGAFPLAGGTDFMVSWNLGLLNHKTVLDLSGVREWSRIETRKSGVSIGSLATHAALQENPAVRGEFPLLAQACATIGAAQIQNRGTLGGNIANASPAADTFPPLAVYDAVVRAVSPRGSRAIPFLEAFAGVKKTTLGSSELIASIDLPFPRRRLSRQVFWKVGTRSAQAISKTVAAGLIWLGRGGAVEELRFALGSMAPTVRRLKAAEGFVAGKKLTPRVIARACELLSEDVSPIDDIRSTREYRLTVSRNILRAFLEGRT